MTKNKKQIFGIFAVIIVLILILGVCVSAALTNGFTNADPYGWLSKDKQAEQGEEDGEDVPIEQTATMSVRLLAGGEAVTASDNGSVSQTLTATVLPADAPDKSVDWTVYWADDAVLKNEPIANYITVTPTSNGSATATVTCLQSFRGSVAYVKCTTRIGGFEAVCQVLFDGIPSSLTLNTTGLQKDSGVNAFEYLLPVNNATSIAINLDNVFGDVGSSYYNNLAISSYTGYGKIKIDNYTVSRVGSSWSGNESEITLESIKNQIATVALNGHNLVITPIKTVENYYQSVTGTTASTTYIGKYKSYVANSAGSANVTPYFKVIVSCGSFNAEFCFRIVSTVSSVSLSNNSITF